MAADALVRLAAEARQRTHANLVPVDAATLIVVDRRGPEPRLLMGRRNARMAFMPGKFVFPGGRVDPTDRNLPLVSSYRPETAARLALRTPRPSLARLERLGLAALRETFEETGLAIGVTSAGSQVRPGIKTSWAEFVALGVLPSLESLMFLARATTPPGRPRRFDTRFFVVDAGAAAARDLRRVGPDSELDQLAWVTIAEARALDLPAITDVVIDELAHRLAEGFEADRPVPYYFERHGKFRVEHL